MLDLSQPRTARDQFDQFGFRAIGRAIVDEDNFECDIPVERRCDLVDQRRDIAGFIADRNDDGNSRRASPCKRFAHDLPYMTALGSPCSSQCARFLWCDKLSGYALAVREARTGQCSNPSIRAKYEAYPACCVPIAHQQHAEHPTEVPTHIIAREVIREHSSAEGNDEGLGPLLRPCAWPQRANGHGGGDRIDGMA